MLSKRVDIRLGYQCNCRCVFCYYQNSVKRAEEGPTTNKVKKLIKMIRKEGASEIEFTGGEPTLRDDLLDIVSYTKSLGFNNISIVTNGLRLSDLNYATKLVNAGINDFLFSIHGHTKHLHDSQTQVVGSFNKVIASIENVRSLSARCRSSTTISGLNYRDVGNIIKMLLNLRMNCIHLAIFSPTIQADKVDEDIYAKYSDIAKFVKKAIDCYQDRLPLLSVKYIPFCFMVGYENYVMNIYQQSFDPDEWNLYFSQKIRRKWISNVLALFGSLLLKDYSFALKHGFSSLKVFGIARIIELLFKKRSRACYKCSYYYVCDHIWRNYYKMFGDSEIFPVKGPMIKDPAWCYDAANYRSQEIELTSNSI